MDNKDAYIEHLENTIKDLQNQVSNLTEMVLLLRKEKFGSSSEKTSYQVEGQISLFNEAEIEADSSAQSPSPKMSVVINVQIQRPDVRNSLKTFRFGKSYVKLRMRSCIVQPVYRI